MHKINQISMTALISAFVPIYLLGLTEDVQHHHINVCYAIIGNAILAFIMACIISLCIYAVTYTLFQKFGKHKHTNISHTSS